MRPPAAVTYVLASILAGFAGAMAQHIWFEPDPRTFAVCSVYNQANGEMELKPLIVNKRGVMICAGQIIPVMPVPEDEAGQYSSGA